MSDETPSSPIQLIPPVGEASTADTEHLDTEHPDSPSAPREFPPAGKMLRIVRRTYDAVTFGESALSRPPRNPDGSLKRTIRSVTNDIIKFAKSWCQSDDVQRQIHIYSNREQYEARKQSLLDSIATAQRHLATLENFHLRGPSLSADLQSLKDSDYEILCSLWAEREVLIQQRRLDRLRSTLAKRSAKRASKTAALKAEKSARLAEQSELHAKRLATAKRISALTGESIDEVMKSL